MSDDTKESQLKRRDAFAAVFRNRSLFGSDDTRESIARELSRVPVAELRELFTSAPTGTRFRFLTDTDLEEMEPLEWLIQDIMQEQALVALFGPPGSGKSFLVLDWTMCVETGIRWAGSRPTRVGHVVYVVAEGGSTLGPRISAWKDYMGAAGEVGVSFVTEPVPLMDAGAVNQFITDVQDHLPEPPTLVIFDTLARCMGGGDENSARDMGLLIQGADRIRQALGCAVLLVHHTNKSGETERGSTALRGAVDTLLKVKKDDHTTITLECEKHKDAPEFRPIEMELKPHRDSVVITAKKPMSVDDDKLTSGELETLRILSGIAPPEGLATGKWEAATEKTERTFFRHVKRLRDGDYVNALTSGRSTRYTVAGKGWEALNDYCHVSVA